MPVSALFPPCATRRFFDISGICHLFCVLHALIRLFLALLQVAIRAGQSRRVVWRLTEQLPRFSRLAFRPLQQLLQQPLQKCNSRESASASRHTRRKPSAKEKHCPWLKQAVSVPTMGVYHRRSQPPRQPTAAPRSPRWFSCLSPAVLTARCHATPSPPSLRSLPPNCRAWLSNYRALSKCRVRFLKCRAWAGATAALRLPKCRARPRLASLV